MADKDPRPSEGVRPAQSFVRPERLQPAGPNPFDNGTSEPAPPLGEPNGVPLEEVVSRTPPEVYEKPAVRDAVTAKAPIEERDEFDRKNIEAEIAAERRLEEAAALSAPVPAEEVTAKPANPKASK